MQGQYLVNTDVVSGGSMRHTPSSTPTVNAMPPRMKYTQRHPSCPAAPSNVVRISVAIGAAMTLETCVATMTPFPHSCARSRGVKNKSR